ncbi:MAG: hypothetical protein M3Y44_12025 [Actinomycetota bacterium]|nr:hypothetical protein [Actinomycetota bacterium]
MDVASPAVSSFDWSRSVGHPDGFVFDASAQCRGSAGHPDGVFRLCDAGGPNCAFAPHAASRSARVYRALKDDPVPIADSDGTTIQYDESFSSRTPPRGTVCEQDLVPFAQPTPVGKTGTARAAAAAASTPALVLAASSRIDVERSLVAAALDAP